MQPNHNHLYGKHRAVVANITDPDGLPERKYKVQIRLLGRWDDVPVKDLPWAEYMFSIGARENEGDALPSREGDLVWVEFVAGDTREPLITGSILYSPEGVPNLPHEAFGGDKSYQHQRTPKQPTPEPAEYHMDRVSAQFGILEELTHDGAKRITHKATGTAIELTKDGQVVIFGKNDVYRSSGGNTLEEVAGGLTIIVKGATKIKSTGQIDMTSGADINITAGGTLNLTGSSTNVKGSPVNIN